MVYGGEGTMTLAAAVICSIIVLLCAVIAEPFHFIIFYRWLSRKIEPVTGERKREFWLNGYRWLVYAIWIVDGLWLWFWTPFMTAQVLFEYFGDHVTKTSVLIERGVYIFALSFNMVNLLIMWFLTECEEHRVAYESIADYVRGFIAIGWGLALGYSMFYVIIMSSVQEDQYFFSGTNYNTWIGVLALLELVVGAVLLGAAVYAVYLARRSTRLVRIDFKVQPTGYGDESVAYNPRVNPVEDPMKAGSSYVVPANFISSRMLRAIVIIFVILVVPYDLLEVIFSFGGCSLNVYMNTVVCFKALTAFHVVMSCPLVLTAQNRKIDYF